MSFRNSGCISPSRAAQHFSGPQHLLTVVLLIGAMVPCTSRAQEQTLSQGTDAPAQDSSQPSHWPQLLGAQYTFVRQHQTELTSPYQGPRSLDPSGDTQSSHTLGVYLGWAVIDHLQLYLDTEKFMGAGVSGAQGLAGLANGDVIRQGAGNLPKRFYIARKFVRYLIPLPFGGSGQTQEAERAQDQLPGPEPASRIEIKVGVLAANDDFDQNRYANSTRTQFMNWSLWNNTAWDFAADTRGYSKGVVVGFVSPRWSLKYGLYQMPERANDQQLEASIAKARGENLELTYKADGGAVLRLLGYRNTARMGIYQDAIALARATGTLPDIVAQDREGRHKWGLGLNGEQPLADDGATGVYARAGWDDGKTESFAFTEVDRTCTVGAQLSGVHWRRTDDRLALAVAVNGLSAPHRQYLAAGGVGFLLGDGRLSYGHEEILESYYRVQLGHYVQLSPDLQYIRNPGYNRDRGPVTIYGVRLHLEY